MPSVSRAQQAAMAIAEHTPSKLYPKNSGLLGMSHQQLHDFAATPTKALPAHVGPHPHKNLGRFLHPPKASLATRITALRSTGAFATPRGASR